MKSEFLDIQSFKILPKENISASATRQDILDAAELLPEFQHISGTPKFITEEKSGDSGLYFSNQFVFSVTSYATEELINILRNAVAVVLYTDLKTLVIFANDIFSNAPLKFTTKSNHDVTDVELTRNTMFLL